MHFLQKKKKYITAIEIDVNWLKIVQGETISNKEIRVCQMLVKKIIGLQEEAISNIIKDLSKEINLGPASVILSTPTHFATIRNPEFPSTDAEEVRDMVDLQMGKQTPYSTAEIVSDYQIVYTSPDGYSRVMLVIVHRDVLNKYSNILKRAGLRSERIALGSDGIVNWSHFAHKDEKVEESNPYLLIDIDYTISNLLIILNNKIIFNRTISLGFSQSVEDIDKWHKEFIEEVERSIYAYQNEMMNKDICKIVIGGAERLIAKLNISLLRNSFNLPVEFVDQFNNIPTTKEVLDLYGGDLKDVSLSSLIGFVLLYKKEEINLLPHEIKIERSMKKKAKDLYLLGTLLAFILLSISSIFFEKIYNKEKYLVQLKKKLATIRDRTDKLDEMVKKMQIIDKRSDARGSVLNLVYEIYRVISPEIHLLSINFDGKQSVILRGASTIMSEVFKFVNELEKSEYFENVKTNYVSKEAEKEGAVEFEIVCLLNANVQRVLR